MPIGAEQWRAVVGSNNVRRPRQVGGTLSTEGTLSVTLGVWLRRTWDKGCAYLHHDTKKWSVFVLTVILLTQFQLADLHHSYTFASTHPSPLVSTPCSGVTPVTSPLVGGGLCLQSFVSMVILLLLLLSGDVETNPGPGNILTEGDLRDVNNIVFKVRAKWYQLGVQLRIPVGTLDSIKHLQGDDNCLLKMLTEWLKTDKPTWEKLADALKSEPIGESNLARKITKDYCSEQTGSKRLSQNSTSPVSPCPKRLCVPGDIDSVCIASYASHLKTKYLEQAGPSEGLLKHSNDICRLAMIQKEKVSRKDIKEEFVRQTITGKVDDILQRKTPIELKDIFTGVQDDCKIVLIEGAPGVGKSSLALNICKKWSEGELFQEFKLVILVQLRDPHVQDCSCISDILPFCEEGITEQLELYIQKNAGEEILWLLDGWDEFPNKCKKDDQCLVRNLIYVQNHNSSVVVTSRPITSVILYPLVSKRIEILGFTPTELRNYFEARLKGNCADSVDTLIQKVKEYPEVHSCCYLPLHAGFVADTFLLKHTLPSTQYGIFETVVLKCISRYQLKQNKEEVKCLESLPESLQKNFTAVCELAYNGMLQSKIVFTDDDLPPDFGTLDLVQEVSSMVAFQNRTKTYNFLHLSIQEFLAAHQLDRKPQLEQEWLFRGLMDEDRCLPMLMFYAAKTKLSAPGIKEFVSTLGNRYVKANLQERYRLCGLLSFAYKCICETEDPSLCKPLVSALNGKFLEVDNIFDYYSLGSFLSLCTIAGDIQHKIYLGTIKLSRDLNFTNFVNDRFPYSTRDITGNEIVSKDWHLFLKGLTRFFREKISTVLTIKIIVSESLINLLLDSLMKPVLFVSEAVIEGSSILQYLEELEFKNCPGLGERLRDILNQNLPGMSSLRVEGFSLSEDHCQLIKQGLANNSYLQCITLFRCQIPSTAGTDYLCQGLFFSKALKVVNLSKNCISNEFSSFLEVLKNPTIEELIINNNKIIFTSLRAHDIKSDSLKVLNISGNNVTDEGVVLLAPFLQNCEVLHSLIADNCGITSKSSKLLLEIVVRSKIRSLLISGVYLRMRFGSNVLDVDCHNFFYSGETLNSEECGFNEKSLLSLPVDNDGAIILVKNILVKNFSIQTIILDTSDTDDIQLELILKSLHLSTHLKQFQVHSGWVSINSLKILGETLKKRTSLLVVLIDNELIEKSALLSHTLLDTPIQRVSDSEAQKSSKNTESDLNYSTNSSEQKSSQVSTASCIETIKDFGSCLQNVKAPIKLRLPNPVPSILPSYINLNQHPNIVLLRSLKNL